MPETLAPLQRKKRRSSDKNAGISYKDYPRKVNDLTPQTRVVRTAGPKPGHIMEGRKPIQQLQRTRPGMLTGRDMTAQEGRNPNPIMAAMTRAQDKEYNKQQRDTFRLTQTRWKAQDEARARIKPIADPEAGKAGRRRKAARRRMRGRMGTILTEKLGSRETIG